MDRRVVRNVMSLPLLLSSPHSGLVVPPEAEPYCILSEKDIVEDGDVGAAEIYHPLRDEAAVYLTTDIARAIIDLNRAEDDRRKDGIVKTHTCWEVPVYKPFPPEEVVEAMIREYYRPYHRRLTELASPELRLAVDCHTMAAFGPPVGPDPGVERPRMCLSNGDGTTCPVDWMDQLKECFEAEFGPHVSVNQPFKGGYITRTHAAEMPWVQLELSRAPFATNAEKSAMVRGALTAWVRH
jgi:formiminoglutamase